MQTKITITFQQKIVPQWLEIDQDNLCMKFLAMNVYFSSLNCGLLGDPHGSLL